ncbi:alpha/beta hydrolase [Humibacter antri]
MGDWQPDVLGRRFEQRTLPLGAEAGSDVVATVVRYRRAPRLEPWLPAAGTDVLYLHGWSDYFFQTELAEFWWRQGARFYALDLRRYGRSLRPGQAPGFVTDLQTYDEDIAAALAVMGRTDAGGGHPSRPLILMGHSTGGLTLSLWAARHPDAAAALVLNSPWLEFQTGSAGRGLLQPLIELQARVAPEGRLPVVDLGFYTRSVAADELGEWTYDKRWRPQRGFPLHPAWLRAVLAGHAQVARGLGLDIPVLTLLSARSLISPVWSDAMCGADTVLDVDRVAERVTKLGALVTIARFEGALHDILLSRRPIRQAAYARLSRWLRTAG